MSTALKFRVDLTPSRCRQYQWLVPALTVWIVLHSLSDDIYTWLSIEYFSLIACALSALFYWLYQQTPGLLRETFILGDDGSWQQTLSGSMPVEGSRELLSSKSRVTPFAIFLGFDSSNKTRWVLKGECTEQNYRRLCRIVLQRISASQEN